MAFKPGYKLPDTYWIDSRNPGMGCYMQPPGHPRYFVQSVYTQYGNSPGHPSSAKFYLPGVGFYTDSNVSVVDKWYGRKAYPKVPMDSERFKAWERHVHQYFKDCYQNGESSNVSDLYIKKGNDPEELVLPYNHRAFRLIKEFYPEYTPNLELIANPPKNAPDWYKTMDHQPTPEDCPGDKGLGRHPVNHTWCQFCGWKASE